MTESPLPGGRVEHETPLSGGLFVAWVKPMVLAAGVQLMGWLLDRAVVGAWRADGLLLGLTVVTSFAYAAYRNRETRAVILRRDHLEIRSVFATARVPLADLTAAIWIHPPADSQDPGIAALILQRPCRFGDEIRFVPKSPEVMTLLGEAIPRGALRVLPRD